MGQANAALNFATETHAVRLYFKYQIVFIGTVLDRSLHKFSCRREPFSAEGFSFLMVEPLRLE